MAPTNQQFLTLSAILTGFSETDLQGTGVLDRHYEALLDTVGESICGDLLTASALGLAQAGADPASREAAIQSLLNDQRFGPLARNIIAMWYLGNWNQLPRAWRDAYGATATDVDRVIAADAYVEGLVWSAIGAHPPGAKQPGFGSWALPPRRDVK